ncbi:hypothetical protein GWI33_022248 [Rhynchophorus ferrugineus]|uniref:Elongator complex protein 2 n=1 Tax=Rhynchophorus ferrugineus TaxID=354439 RepID=A0A834MJ33_RHYFE|nr:hypothetical protein GWI33_022248 [Rhynchophorus ferrugineus]
MYVRNCYISSNCNQTPTAADCSSFNKIAYGSCNSVLIYDPQYGSGGKVVHTLIGHTKRVNSVRWLRGRDMYGYPQDLVSGGTDGNVIVWVHQDKKYYPVFLKDNHYPDIFSVNIVDGYYKDQQTVICSVSMNEYSLRIWRKELGKEFHLQHRLAFGLTTNPTFCVGLRMCIYPKQNNLIIACALDNSKVEILIEKSDNTWNTIDKLSGHDDWVRGLDFCELGNGDLLLASCSQDSFIRLWRLTTLVNNEIKIYLESVLAGHEGWVYSVNWNLETKHLLSASIDKTMIIWEFDKASGLWLEKVRVGEVGGNTLGFYGGFFSPTSDEIIAYSYHGAFHIWSKNINNVWDPAVTLGGHFDEVIDISWEPKGEFLYSVSNDQTTRIHAPWQKPNREITWHEIARPQVHGYGLSSIAVISRNKFAAGAEEKIIRIFDAPETFVKNLKRLCNLDDIESNNLTFIPKGASVPSLGLSNKAVFTNDNIDDILPVDNKNPYPEESHFVAQILTEPPTEETLLQNTLWPETQKLYGHGYEIFSLAASPDGKYLASACKSTKASHAAIFIWDTSDWKQLQSLISHNLTVVQMQFSPDSKSTTNKETSIHTRIIWTCAWTHDSKYFATGSREGKLVLWIRNSGKESVPPLGEVSKVSEPLDFPDSVTAVAFAPGFIYELSYLVAVGFEKGTIEILKITNLQFEKVYQLDNELAHHLTVKKLVFRPRFGKAGFKEENQKLLQLASCSSDTSVRIYNISL